MSVTFNQRHGRNIIIHTSWQENEYNKLRPISAAVVRSPNVRLRESWKDKRDFKIWNLDDENRVKNIIKVNDYNEHQVIILQNDLENKDELVMSFSKVRSQPVKHSESEKVERISKNGLAYKRLSWEPQEAELYNDFKRDNIVIAPTVQPRFYKSGVRSNVQTPSDKTPNNKITKIQTASFKPTVKQIHQPVMTNLFEEKRLSEAKLGDTNENAWDEQSSNMIIREGKVLDSIF